MWPIWSVRFLPMQDYPQHLFIAYVTATFEDPSLAWGRFYLADLAVRPYRLAYLIERFLASFFDIEVAGKLVISGVIILTSIFVAKNAEKCSGKDAPWGLLVLFPLIFNQFFYLGFQSYLLSLPILFLALMDLDSFTVRRASRSLWRRLAGLSFQDSSIWPALMATFSPSLLRCRSAATGVASMIWPPIDI